MAEHPLHAAARLAHRRYAEVGGMAAAGDADRACAAWRAAGCPEEITDPEDVRADERARIVAHLRERAARYGRDGCAEPPGSRLMDLLAAADAALTLAADAIERGEVDDG